MSAIYELLQVTTSNARNLCCHVADGKLMALPSMAANTYALLHTTLLESLPQSQVLHLSTL